MISDSVIKLLFSLFVASTVNERIIDFMKSWFPRTFMKKFNFYDEIRRKRKITLLVLGMGFITANIMEIELFQLLHDIESEDSPLVPNPTRPIDPNIANQFRVDSFLELLITAILIGLGSRFWHDLLDVTLFIKKARRKVHNFDPKTVDDIKEIDKYLEENEYTLATKALETHRQRLYNAYGKDASFYVGYEYVDNQNRVCIQVWDRKKKKNKTPNNEPKRHLIKQFKKIVKEEYEQLFGHIKHITYTTDYGYIFRFPVIMYHPGEAKISTSFNENRKHAGGGLFHSSTDENVGTFGCLVKKQDNKCQDIFLLTCYHCVKTAKQKWERHDPEIDKGAIYYKEHLNAEDTDKIGTISLGYRSGYMDIALIKPHNFNVEKISDYYWSYNKTVPNGTDTIETADTKDRREVWFSGIRSGSTKAYITNHKFAVEINYGSKEGVSDIHLLDNLIVFSKNKTAPYEKPCDRGDSGAVLIDAKTYQAIGMIVAVDDKFGYAIPIKDILDNNRLSLYNDPCLINSIPETKITTI